MSISSYRVQTTNMSKIPTYPFCGSDPIFPEAENVYGTCYEAGCEDCGIATISIQIIDCFDFDSSPSRNDAHDSWDDDKAQYGVKFIEIVRNKAIAMWSNRTP